MAYRKFKMINSNNEVWEFTNKQVKSFLNSPSNLGFSSSLTSTRYGDAISVASEEIALPQPSGEVIFYDSKNEDRYQKYYNFCRFLTYTPLRLVYTLPLETPVDYEIDCYVTNLAKSETTTEKVLKCAINFRGISFWKGETQTITGTETEYNIVNNGDFPVGFEITINGNDMRDISIELSQNSETYGIARLYDKGLSSLFGQIDKVYINSNDGKQNIILENDGAVIPNPLSYQDLSVSNGAIYVTFIKVAKGNSTISINNVGGSISNVEIKYTPIFRSV